MKRITSIILSAILMSSSCRFVLGDSLAPIGMSEIGLKGPREVESNYKIRLSRIDDLRRSAKEVKDHDLRRRILLNAFSKCTNFIPNRETEIGRLNCRGYCANEIARVSLFKLRDLERSEFNENAEKITALGKEMDTWIQSCAIPDLRDVLNINRAIQERNGTMSGYFRACSGYSFGMSLMAERDFIFSKCFPAERRKWIRNALLKVATAISYGVKGAKGLKVPQGDQVGKENEEEKHIRDALVGALKTLDKILLNIEENSLPIEDLNQASHRRNQFKDIINILNDIGAIKAINEKDKSSAKTVLEKTRNIFVEADKLIKANNDLPAIFLEVATSKNEKDYYKDLEEFALLIEFEIQQRFDKDTADLLKQSITLSEDGEKIEISGHKHDFKDIAIIRALAADDAVDSWEINALLNKVWQKNTAVTSFDLVQRIPVSQYRWLGLEPRLEKKMLQDSAESKNNKTLGANKAGTQLDIDEKWFKKYEYYLKKLEVWISADEFSRLNSFFSTAEGRFQKFKTKFNEVKRKEKKQGKGKIPSKDLEALYALFEGGKEFPGYKAAFIIARAKIDNSCDRVINSVINELQLNLKNLANRADAVVSTVRNQETEALRDDVSYEFNRSQNLSNRSSGDFLSEILYQELINEKENKESEINALESRVNFWAFNRDRILKARESLDGVTILKEDVKIVMEAAEKLLEELDKELNKPKFTENEKNNILTAINAMEILSEQVASTYNELIKAKEEKLKSINKILEGLEFYKKNLEKKAKADFQDLENNLKALVTRLNGLIGPNWNEEDWGFYMQEAEFVIERFGEYATSITESIILFRSGAGNAPVLFKKMDVPEECSEVGDEVKAFLKERMIKSNIDNLLNYIEKKKILFYRRDSVKDNIGEGNNKAVLEAVLAKFQLNDPIGLVSTKLYFYGAVKDNLVEILAYIYLIVQFDEMVNREEIKSEHLEVLMNSGYFQTLSYLDVGALMGDIDFNEEEKIRIGWELIKNMKNICGRKSNLSKVQSLLMPDKYLFDDIFNQSILKYKEITDNRLIKSIFKELNSSYKEYLKMTYSEIPGYWSRFMIRLALVVVGTMDKDIMSNLYISQKEASILCKEVCDMYNSHADERTLNSLSSFISDVPAIMVCELTAQWIQEELNLPLEIVREIINSVSLWLIKSDEGHKKNQEVQASQEVEEGHVMELFELYIKESKSLDTSL
ncbi:MAG: hypothetical protein ABII27_03320 [bacterium]